HLARAHLEEPAGGPGLEPDRGKLRPKSVMAEEQSRQEAFLPQLLAAPGVLREVEAAGVLPEKRRGLFPLVPREIFHLRASVIRRLEARCGRALKDADGVVEDVTRGRHRV